MSLLDKTSFFSNNTINAKWANGKTGAIIPTNKNQYIFVEHVYIEDRLELKYPENEWEEKSPVLAYGFVYYWLRHRKRKCKCAERLDLFVPEDRGKTPKEIYDLYIEARKSWFLEYMSNRPDAWKYPDLEKMFYEKELTRATEKELILKSEPLLEYLDEEDKDEFVDVMKNFLNYVAHIVEPYQHIMENAARKKQVERNSRTLKALIKRAQEEADANWPNPERVQDDNIYTIDSPEVLEYAKKLTDLQTEILRQLVANAGEIETWQENPILNEYSEPEIWEACCSLYTDSIINAFIDWGHVSALRIEDKGKLVLRKHNMVKTSVNVSILPGYEVYVTSVFLPSYRFCETNIDTYPEVVNTFNLCVDPNEPAQVPIFLRACISKNCARKSAQLQPQKVVKALIGLGILKFNTEEEEAKFTECVSRKNNRISDKELRGNDETIYNSVVDSLSRPTATAIL